MLRSLSSEMKALEMSISTERGARISGDISLQAKLMSQIKMRSASFTKKYNEMSKLMRTLSMKVSSRSSSGPLSSESAACSCKTASKNGVMTKVCTMNGEEIGNECP